ncbi:MAG: alpha/beta hydrolase [Bradyrhizobium sp.]
MAAEFVLVAGPMVRAASWEPTADHLRQAGWPVQVPDLLSACATPPPWSTWSRHLLDHIAPTDDLILVGHSSASALVADLATKLPASALIIVDGDIPPTQGPAAPVRPALHDFVRSLAGADGMLPVWSRWFARDPQRAALVGLDQLAGDPLALARFEDGLPTMKVDWFDDAIDLARWDHVPAGFVQASPIYDHATAEAFRRGWPVERLNGTHLHPTLCPDETADAILSLVRRLWRRC